MNGLTSEQVSELHGDLVVLGRELDALLEMSEDIAKPIELEQPIGRLSRMDAMQQREMAMANRAAHERLLLPSVVNLGWLRGGRSKSPLNGKKQLFVFQ